MLFPCRHLVLAPEHDLLPSLISEAQHESVRSLDSFAQLFCINLKRTNLSMQVEEYRDLAAKKSELERTDLQKEKSGVFSGLYAKNPATGEVIPIWVADYVLGRFIWTCFLQYLKF